MTNKYFGGTVTDTGVAEEVDADLKAVVENTAKAVDEKMKDLRVAECDHRNLQSALNAATNILMRLHHGYLEKMSQRKIVCLLYYGI